MKHITLLLILMILLAACKMDNATSQRYTAFDDLIDHSKPIAFGEDEDIYVFCSLENRSRLEPILKATLEREVALVYNEPYFNLIYADIKEIENLKRYKNLLFVGGLDEADPVSRYLKEALAPALQERVYQSTGEIFLNKNRFVKDQLILQAIGINNDKVRDLLSLSANRIFDLFLGRYTKRLAYQAYQSKVIKDDFFKPYPYSLKIPETYQLFSNDKDNRFLSLLYRARMQNTEIPDKFISVYHEPMDANLVDEKWLIDQRTRIGKMHFDGDSLNVQTLRTESFQFAGHQGFRLSGAWINPKRIAGGAFQSYAFWDDKSKTAYLVDTMVYFPAGNKLPTLMELFMIASSLKIK